MKDVDANINAERDAKLVALALDGDERAFTELMLLYKKPVYRILFNIVRNHNDSEDLTIEAFGKAFINLHSYSPEYPFNTWLFKVATNNCIDFLRRRKSENQHLASTNSEYKGEEQLMLKSNTPDPEEYMITKQRGIMLRRFVGKLKPIYQKMIELRYFKEYSYGEIAKELDLPLGTVKTQLFRARNSLLKLMENTGVNH